MKVTLVYPGIGILGFGKVDIDGSGESKWINHGLALIGAYIKENGHDVDLIDMRTLNNWEEFRDEIIKKNPDLIGISCSYLDWKVASKAFDYIKGVNSKIKTVAGGLFPSIFPNETSKNQNIDYIVIGEGEEAIMGLIENGNGHQRILRTSPLPNLENYPFAYRELFDYQRELSCGFAPGQTDRVVTMIAGRGCPFNCSYCQPAEKAVFGGKFRMRSPNSVITELKILKDKYQFKSITWWDDTFTVVPKWIKEFCGLYQANGFTANMAACSRTDIICKNEEMIKKLSEIGLDCLVIGFETGTQRLLDFIKKGTTVEQNFKAAEICRRHDIKIFGTFMLGLPTETKKESEATMKMVEKIQCDHHMIFYFTPIPGTDIYTYCEENNLILRDDLFDIERTSQYDPKIKEIDYAYLNQLREGK